MLALIRIFILQVLKRLWSVLAHSHVDREHPANHIVSYSRIIANIVWILNLSQLHLLNLVPIIRFIGGRIIIPKLEFLFLVLLQEHIILIVFHKLINYIPLDLLTLWIGVFSLFFFERELLWELMILMRLIRLLYLIGIIFLQLLSMVLLTPHLEHRTVFI